MLLNYSSLLPLQVAEACAFLPLALSIAGSTPFVVESPSSANAWRKLHENILMETVGSVQEARGEEATKERSLNSALGVSFGALGEGQRRRFLLLAVLADGVHASKEMLSRLWNQVHC